MTLAVVHAPALKAGRPRIYGTILEDEGGKVCLTRLVYSLAENAGNSGSPRVEVWVGVRENGMTPVVVRRAGAGDWREAMPADFGVRRPEVERALMACGYQMSDVWAGNPAPDWPTTIWDRRVILPDDDRWPRGKQHLIEPINGLLAERNTCPDEDVWAIDARILSLAQREKVEDHG